MRLKYSSFYIDGRWTSPASSDRIELASASTEEPIGSVPDAVGADVDAAVDSARRAFDDPQGWANWPAQDRADLLERLADTLAVRSEETCQRVSAQNGMPISVARSMEGIVPTGVLYYYASLIRESATEESRPGVLGGTTLVQQSPVGVVAAIVPWNFPSTLSSWKYAPALAAGCTVVVKPSPETVLDAYVLAEAAEAVGLPPGVLNIVPGGRAAGAQLVAHPGVDKVSFTGSTSAGRTIGEVCGRLLRPVTLELGGKSAAIVLDDPDLDLAALVEPLFMTTMVNNGQTCFLASRVLAPRSRYEEVVGFFTEFVRSLSVGDALDPMTQVGPLASLQQRDRVEAYIAKGLGDGARITVGGGRPAGLDRGWFVEPTVFVDVDNGSTIAQEEIFGPVITIIPYEGDDQAVALANDSEYGLAGAVFTSDVERGLSVARRIHTGTIGVNHYLPDPGAPFGGVKASGLGRELGPEGLAQYRTLKSIYLSS